MPNSEQHPEIWKLLDAIPDPEIPVISIIELGVVREVQHVNSKVTITITPTYSGCPAVNLFQDEIVTTLNNNGYTDVEINTTYSPAWTTDWMPETAKQKLKEFGIAPPEIKMDSHDKLDLFKDNEKVVACPYCNSTNSHLESQFGSTACKALYFCDDCIQPFEHFKCI
jgi:ring-1,2-phenylacetyl-CoA epoxidase subunit PaaD